jgi:hypothetical protein
MRILLIIAIVLGFLWYGLTPHYDLEVSHNGRDYQLVQTGLGSLEDCRDAAKGTQPKADWSCLKWTRLGKRLNQHSPYDARYR